MGLLYIASHIMEHTDHEVAVVDAQLEELDYDEIEERIRAFSPDVVGITAYTMTFLDTLEIAARAKRVNPDVYVVLGGAHTHAYPRETAMLRDVDVSVPGEGEEVMTEIVEALAHNRPLTEVPGIWLKGEKEAVSTGQRAPIADLDALPFPARALLPLKAYKFVTDVHSSSTTMISSRGCNFNCSFCDVPFRAVRGRSPENVVREIIECKKLGYDEINFYDDNFNYKEERVNSICREIINHELEIRFSIRARVDKITPDSVQMLKKAGCGRINFGIEAGDNESLKAINKKITTDMAKRAVELTKSAGIEVAGYFMISIPGQEEEQVHRTIDFALELGLDYAQFNWTFLFPRTELYRQALKAGAFESDFYLDFARSPHLSDIIAYWENPIPFDRAHQLTKLAHKKFYLRPRYLFRQLRGVGSLGELVRKGRAGYEVLTYALFPWKAFRPVHLRKK